MTQIDMSRVKMDNMTKKDSKTLKFAKRRQKVISRFPFTHVKENLLKETMKLFDF